MKLPFRLKKLKTLGVIPNLICVLLLSVLCEDDLAVLGLGLRQSGSTPYYEDLDYSYSYKLNSGVKVPVGRNFRYMDSSSGRNSSGSGSGFYSTAYSAHYPTYIHHRNSRDRSSSFSSAPGPSSNSNSKYEPVDISPVHSYRDRDPEGSRHSLSYNRFGFPNPVGTTTTTESTASSAAFFTRRGGELSKKLYTPSYSSAGTSSSRFDGFVQQNQRPSVASQQRPSVGSQERPNGYYNYNYDSPSSSSRDKYNFVTSRPYRTREPFFSNDRSPSLVGGGGGGNDLLLSHMLDTSTSNGDTQLDIQQRLRIYELLYSNNSALAVTDESRQLAVIPQNCWHGGKMYGCGLSVTCVLQGSKPMDLCNGGMIWSCCVPRERVNEISAAGAGLIDNPSSPVENLTASPSTHVYDLYPNQRPGVSKYPPQSQLPDTIYHPIVSRPSIFFTTTPRPSYQGSTGNKYALGQTTIKPYNLYPGDNEKPGSFHSHNSNNRPERPQQPQKPYYPEYSRPTPSYYLTSPPAHHYPTPSPAHHYPTPPPVYPHPSYPPDTSNKNDYNSNEVIPYPSLSPNHSHSRPNQGNLETNFKNSHTNHTTLDITQKLDAQGSKIGVGVANLKKIAKVSSLNHPGQPKAPHPY